MKEGYIGDDNWTIHSKHTINRLHTLIGYTHDEVKESDHQKKLAGTSFKELI